MKRVFAQLITSEDNHCFKCEFLHPHYPLKSNDPNQAEKKAICSQYYIISYEENNGENSQVSL